LFYLCKKSQSESALLAGELLKAWSPIDVQALASRVFHPDGHISSTRAVCFKHLAFEQVSAARILHLYCHGAAQSRAARVIDLDRHHFASRKLHRKNLPLSWHLQLSASSAHWDQVDAHSMTRAAQ
jgi:hypothetical protein